MGYTQSQFAAFGGVQSRAQIHYEKGERMPDANYLMAITAIGVDVCYILTGHRKVDSNPMEDEILAVFRRADDRVKIRMAMAMGEIAAKQKEPEKPTVPQVADRDQDDILDKKAS